LDPSFLVWTSCLRTMKSTTCDSRPAAVGTLLALGVLYFFPSVQAANAECKPAWGWSYNSKGENPCRIAATLQSSCLGRPNFELQPLNPGNRYASPLRDTPVRKRCGCNTVIFGLYMACTLCQNSTSTTTWTGWSQFCDNVYVTQYPFDLPQDSTVPHWAYLDYTKEDNFNPTFAESVGRDPETTPPAASSATNPPPTATVPPNEGDDQEGNSGGSASNAGAIAGGVVGGAAGLLVIATLVFFFLRHRKQRTQQAHVIDLDLAEGAEWGAVAMQEAHKPQRLYDPSDPSTFPDPVSADGENYEPPQAHITPARFGKYTGRPEV